MAINARRQMVKMIFGVIAMLLHPARILTLYSFAAHGGRLHRVACGWLAQSEALRLCSEGAGQAGLSIVKTDEAFK